ncbi:YggS family pyridoxal phosphate-dependent enzyme [Wenzhouxiangella sp. AB-CW3]|uniref:YggS family pyridoxal phosphate-dependent enzyme n=1 Tax=Wenzhouxiangella sp. AB-CW3 TaxID=2771012 RepID=UPI00168A7757|nr:YggS family pyridoxal phosphate-dependent enzyme [Wenzhouxiangella sp. AB-CW3]QOC22419.1 YggS family pyridoxal phosphate-dependent enzyme [Wenzhouxiangella sp. AB-CW3]
MNPKHQEKFDQVIERMTAACRACGRNPGDVRLLAVSKTHPAEAVRTLYALGQRAFGESYVDEAVQKIDALGDLELEWHYIGPIQSNKTRQISARFDWVQSVDRLKIVRRLADQRPADRPPLNVLIQVNIDDEPQKAGCRSDEVDPLAAEIAARDNLRLRGLMAIPAPREGASAQQQVFDRLFALYRHLQSGHTGVDTLSAGMTADLEAAIAAGSTMVRVGTALFGARTTV